MVFGLFVSFARTVQRLGLWTQIIQANVDYCCVWAAKRRAEYTSLGPGLKHPSLL